MYLLRLDKAEKIYRKIDFNKIILLIIFNILYLTLKYANVRYMHALTFTLYTLIIYSNPMLARHITSHIWDGRKMVLKERERTEAQNLDGYIRELRIKTRFTLIFHKHNLFFFYLLILFHLIIVVVHICVAHFVPPHLCSTSFSIALWWRKNQKT